MRSSDWITDVCSSDLRPCQLFDGESAINACRHAIGFERAVALHGLGLGLDSSPAIVSGIPVAAFLSDSANSYFGASPPRIREEPSRKRHGAPALYSCIISAELDRGHLHVFGAMRSEEQTSELQSLMRISYAVFCLKK